MRTVPALLVAFAALALVACPGSSKQETVEVVWGPDAAPAAAKAGSLAPPEVFLALFAEDQATFDRAIGRIEESWRDSYAVMLLEVLRFHKDKSRKGQIFGALLRGTKQQALGFEVKPWYQWVWTTQPTLHPGYGRFKELLYSRVDARFAEHFQSGPKASIRLDEVHWGGVVRDGVPPLRNPKTLAVAEATYLADDDVVFGVVHNGEARAYPRRILASHELVQETIGGEAMCGVYCPLCGAMIVYRAGAHTLGTSGFLYRSSKLLYDEGTKSLWSTLTGKAVVGPLVGGAGGELEPIPVVTTTWAEWRTRHPETRVLSIETGFARNYTDAYRGYFETDDLWFPVPELDDRLANKAEVLAVRPEGTAPVAVSVELLAKTPVHAGKAGEVAFVVLTDASGASRVYASGERSFSTWDGKAEATDEQGRTWTVHEDRLALGDASLPRLLSHRVFWFGFHSAFPKAELVR